MGGSFWSAHLVEDVFCLHGIIHWVSVDLEVGKAEPPAPLYS